MTSSQEKAVHKFSLRRAKDAEFKGEGLRPFFSYRNLGIEEAINGEFGASVIRAENAPKEPTGSHRDALNFQMVYVLLPPG